jgi:hypothetical protein
MKNENCFITYNDNGYYLAYKRSISRDATIADKIKMPLGEYLANLEIRFNAFTIPVKNEYYGNAYFKKPEDAQKALEWVESALVMATLVGDEDEE